LQTSIDLLALSGARARAPGTAPDPRAFGLILAIALGATAVEATFGSMAGRNGVTAIPWLWAFRLTLPTWITAAALAPLVIALAERFPFRGRSWVVPLLVHLLGAAVFVGLHLGVSVALTPVVTGRPMPWLPGVLDMLRLYSLAEILLYASIVGAWNAVLFHRQALARERDAADLTRRLTEARLDALRLQLQPHFLFNTLHTISAMARRNDPDALIQTVAHFGDLLRVVLDDQLRGEVPLEQELAFLRKYVAIQQVRFQDRLTVHWEIADDCADALVPPLILQPLVENALIHGIESRPGRGEIRLSARRERSLLLLSVEDSGPGLHAPEARRGNGVGLANTMARLDHAHPGGARLSEGRLDHGGARFVVEMPFVTAASRGRP
jgi:hypothetical protein